MHCRMADYPDILILVDINCSNTNRTHLLFNVLYLLHTCCKALCMSIPCPHGTAGLAKQSPALPRREMSILCFLRFWKASYITRTPSYVSAEVYYTNRRVINTIYYTANTEIMHINGSIIRNQEMYPGRQLYEINKSFETY